MLLYIMKLYDNINGIILFSCIFILWAINLGIQCPCNKETTNLCTRHEIYGVQYNHFILFIFLGFYFPSYFFTLLCISILWEYFEYLLDKNPDFVVKYIGGCLSKPPANYNHSKNKIHNYYVLKGIPKYINPIDKYFNIKNSTLHGWHGSPAEIIPNVLGFGFGYILNKIYYLLIKKIDS